MFKKLIWVLVLLFASQAFAKKVDYPYLGIQFSVPKGWQGFEDEAAYIMQSPDMSGAIVIMLNEAQSAAELKREADQGIVDGFTTSLKRSSDFKQVGAEGLGAEFSGLFDSQQAKAYVIGLINPFGQSITVGAVTTKKDYSQRYQALALEVANSVGFAAPKESKKTMQWREWLPGNSLTYLKSSYSSGSGYVDSGGTTYGTYSSYSNRKKINFCNHKYFTYYSSSQSSFDSGGGFGGVASSGDAAGEWSLSTSADGTALLKLQFNNGKVIEYKLAEKDGGTYLDDRRYYYGDAEGCR